MKVYVFSYEDVNVDFYTSYVKVYATKKLAQNEAKIILKDIKENIYSYKYMVLEHLANGNGFEMYEEGRYNENHIFVRIEEKEVIENE